MGVCTETTIFWRSVEVMEVIRDSKPCVGSFTDSFSSRSFRQWERVGRFAAVEFVLGQQLRTIRKALGVYNGLLLNPQSNLRHFTLPA